MLFMCRDNATRINLGPAAVIPWEIKQVAQRATIAHLSRMCQGQISFQKIKLIQALMLVLVTWKYQKDPIKNNREKVETQLSPL